MQLFWVIDDEKVHVRLTCGLFPWARRNKHCIPERNGGGVVVERSEKERREKEYSETV